MSENSETLAEIVAEMRKRMKSYYYSREGRNLMRQYAGRIEAAWKRQEQCYLDQIRDAVNQWGHEKYKAEHAPVGNSAAMREALVRTDLFLSALGKWLKVNDEGQEYALAAGVIHTLVDHALAAPTRNCDMPLVVDGPADNNADKAWLVFKRHNPDAYFDAPGLLRCIDWLLAPATEQKGETDAK